MQTAHGSPLNARDKTNACQQSAYESIVCMAAAWAGSEPSCLGSGVAVRRPAVLQEEQRLAGSIHGSMQ